MLFDMIDGKPVEDRFITLPTELIIRESSGGSVGAGHVDMRGEE